MKKKLGIGLITLVFICLFLAYFFILNFLPASLSLTEGSESIYTLNLPFDLYIQGMENRILKINGQELQEGLLLVSGKPLKLEGLNAGTAVLNLKLFGFIPLKSITVNILPDVKVYPGGQAIGVLLRSNGVMVVGKSFVDGEDGHRYFPAQEAGIRVGDTILKINDQEIHDKVKLSSLIQQYARKDPLLNFEIKDSSGKVKTLQVRAVKNKQGNYMIGLYVDDGVAGVGTLTFYEPVSKQYGALGHEIIEMNSQQPIEVREGKIIEAQISGINSGRKGMPGEKLGTFFQTNNILGDIHLNNEFGIFGELKQEPDNPYFQKPIPVATISQVKTGPASIYTVVEGGKIEEFEVEIEKLYHQSRPDSKGMIINITDDRLKKITGGIIQGMSGSPIVQDGKLVGAVTHVFVNEPTKGYGVFAQWMLLQTDIYNKMTRASGF